MVIWHHIAGYTSITKWYPLVMTNIAIENDPVEIVDFPIEHGDFP